jgi:hypothetical protein
MENIIILHTNIYDFEDDKTQKRISGVKMQYIFSDDLEPIAFDQDDKGYQVASATMPKQNDYMLEKVPGVYKPKFITRVNAKGQPVQKLAGVEYICTVPELFTTQTQAKSKTA